MQYTVNTDASTSPQRLRIGLLIDSFVQRKWIYKVIQDVQSSGFAEISVVIQNVAETPKKGRLESYWKNRKYWLYAMYSKIDETRVRVDPDAFESTDIRDLLAGCPVLEVKPVMKAYSDWFPDETIEQIRVYDLDVALAFGFRILKGDVLNLARHGIWSFHHGDNLVNRGGPAGFWEVMDDVPVTGSVLQILTEDLDNGKVIYRSWSPTSDRFSVKANRNNLYWKSSHFVIRKLRELAEGDAIAVSENQLYRPYSHRLFKQPTNSEMLPRLLRLGRKYAASKIDSVFNYEQWSLAYKFRSGPGDSNNTLYRFRHLLPPEDRFWADPFAAQVDNKYYVFIEEYLYKTGKGHISVIELDKSGIVNGPTKVLERDYHLSYPFVFEWNQNYYMIPESASNGTIELYRATSFPHTWDLERTLMTDVRAKDATLAEVDGTWWMFLSTSENSIPDELYLYHAQSPLGPWIPHRRNPVKSDVRGSRPAGKLFHWNGDLYRPAQDSSGRYGYAISINKIIQLDAREFREVEVSKILPKWRKDLVATHTINSLNDLTVTDCLMRRRR